MKKLNDGILLSNIPTPRSVGERVVNLCYPASVYPLNTKMMVAVSEKQFRKHLAVALIYSMAQKRTSNVDGKCVHITKTERIMANSECASVVCRSSEKCIVICKSTSVVSNFSFFFDFI